MCNRISKIFIFQSYIKLAFFDIILRTDGKLGINIKYKDITIRVCKICYVIEICECIRLYVFITIGMQKKQYAQRFEMCLCRGKFIVLKIVMQRKIYDLYIRMFIMVQLTRFQIEDFLIQCKPNLDFHLAIFIFIVGNRYIT